MWNLVLGGAVAALMRVCFKALEGRTPDPAWDERMSGTTAKFRERKDRAAAWTCGSSAAGLKP